MPKKKNPKAIMEEFNFWYYKSTLTKHRIKELFELEGILRT